MAEGAGWNWLRQEIGAACDAYLRQLDGLRGDEHVPNLDWTAAELTAHLASLPEVYRRQHAIASAFEAPDDWAQFSIDQRKHIAIDDLDRLGELLRAEISGFLDAIEDPEAARWLYGCETTDRNVAGALLVELIIHGQDLGRLTGAKPTLTTEHAAAALPNTMAIVSAFVDRDRARKVAGTYHLGFRGHGDWSFDISDAGELVCRPGRPEQADAHLSADPAAFLLVSLGRVNQFLPALKGQMVADGRKPWRLIAIGNLAVDGI